jgi:hypothetical protein
VAPGAGFHPCHDIGRGLIVADLERMKTLPSVAAGTLVLACLVALGAGLLASYAH